MDGKNYNCWNNYWKIWSLSFFLQEKVGDETKFEKNVSKSDEIKSCQLFIVVEARWKVQKLSPLSIIANIFDLNPFQISICADENIKKIWEYS